MKVKTDLVFLGFVRQIVWLDFDGSEHSERWKKGAFPANQTDRKKAGLFVTSDAKTLYFIPWASPKISKAPPGFELHKKAFERWANRPAKEQIRITIPANIKTLDHCGYLKEIEYTSDKFERAGDSGEYNLYFHEYETRPGPALYVNCPIRPYIWGVKDPSDRKLMTYRGLVL